MNAGILYGAKDIRVGQVSDPVIGPDDILLESHAAGICGTDLHIYRGEFEEQVHYLAVQGHEFGWVIAEADKNLSGFEAGDRVVVDPIISCHKCPMRSRCLHIYPIKDAFDFEMSVDETDSPSPRLIFLSLTCHSMRFVMLVI